MVAIKNILFFSTAVLAATLGRRDAATITTDLNTIDSQVQKLTSAVNAFTGDLGAALAIQNIESQLETDIKQGTTDAKASGPVSSADSASIVGFVNNQLVPDVQASLNALVSKKAQFTSAGVASIVKSDLNALKTETDDLGAALIAIASADQVSNAQAAQAKIDSAFATAIAAYA